MDKAENKSKEFIKQILNIRDYWLNIGKEQNYDSKTIVNGTIFSVLVMLDGDSSNNDFHSIELIDKHDGKRIDCGYIHELLGVVEKERTEKEGENMTKALQCATEFAKWLGKNDLTRDTYIYVDKKRYKVNENGELIYDIDADPHRYIEFAGDFMTVSTEGALYDILNYYNDFVPGYDDRKNKEMDNIFKKYGYYSEMGNSWNFTLCQI